MVPVHGPPPLVDGGASLEELGDGSWLKLLMVNVGLDGLDHRVWNIVLEYCQLRKLISDEGATDLTRRVSKGFPQWLQPVQDLAKWLNHRTAARGIKLQCVETWEKCLWDWVNPFLYHFHPVPPHGKSRGTEGEDLCIWDPFPKEMKCSQLT